jgi:hypothetical protein
MLNQVSIPLPDRSWFDSFEQRRYVWHMTAPIRRVGSRGLGRSRIGLGCVTFERDLLANGGRLVKSLFRLACACPHTLSKLICCRQDGLRTAAIVADG